MIRLVRTPKPPPTPPHTTLPQPIARKPSEELLRDSSKNIDSLNLVLRNDSKLDDTSRISDFRRDELNDSPLTVKVEVKFKEEPD